MVNNLGKANITPDGLKKAAIVSEQVLLLAKAVILSDRWQSSDVL